MMNLKNWNILGRNWLPLKLTRSVVVIAESRHKIAVKNTPTAVRIVYALVKIVENRKYVFVNLISFGIQIFVNVFVVKLRLVLLECLLIWKLVNAPSPLTPSCLQKSEIQTEGVEGLKNEVQNANDMQNEDCKKYELLLEAKVE
jgi:hypothetical protein